MKFLVNRHSLVCALQLLVLALPILPTAASAAEPARGIYIIYDSSNSMWGVLPDRSRKYEAARRAINYILKQRFRDSEVAFRMYGHRYKGDCTDSQLIVPFGAPNSVRNKVLDAVASARPTGKTPIDLSLRMALDDFGSRSGSIILVSDGIESCGADPCALVSQWKAKNIDISVHVVGLGLKGKERESMQCIASAAGTKYRDAFSADELTESIAAVVSAEVTKDEQTGASSAVESRALAGQKTAFGLIVKTADDVRQRGVGILSPLSGDGVFEVETFRRFDIPPGRYQLEAGVEVVGGAFYRPVQQTVDVSESGITYAEVTAVRPPEVSATFSMAGEQIRSTVVTVYQNGKKLGSFKGDETVFVPEGELEFRAKPAGSSRELRIRQVIQAGDNVVIAFAAEIEVHLIVRAIASATGDLIKSKPAVNLTQNGKIVDKINRNSGGLVTPGNYTVVVDDGLNQYSRVINVTHESEQIIELTVPTGSVTVSYEDATGQVEEPKRIFVKRISDGKRSVRRSNEAVALVPGRYIVDGHPKAAGYPSTTIDIEAGSALRILLKATN